MDMVGYSPPIAVVYRFWWCFFDPARQRFPGYAAGYLKTWLRRRTMTSGESHDIATSLKPTMSLK